MPVAWSRSPSIEMAAAIAEALEVSLDYLVGNIDLLLEKNVVNKIMDIQKRGTEDKAHVFAMLDAFLQSHKTKKYSPPDNNNKAAVMRLCC